MKYSTILSMVFSFAFLAFLSNVQAQEITQISPVRAKLMARNGAMMIDVREKDEVQALAYDVKGIVNIPLSEFEFRLSEIPKDKDVIVACRSGHRSSQAAEMLAKNGFTKIYNMEGGMLLWKEKDLGVIVNGQKAPKKACCAKGSKSCAKGSKCCAKGSKSCAKGKKCCSKGKKSAAKAKPEEQAPAGK